jgi:tetratricopeptide (TPR) repeat protein
VEALKQRGNAAFRQKDYETALQLYRDALELCDQTMVGGGVGGGGTAAQDQEEQQQLSSLDELERDCLLNCAAASLQLEEPASAAACCDAAVAIDPTHPKAFYRRGQAYAALGKRKRALSDYERAAGLAPKNAAIQKAYRAAKQEALNRMEEKQMLRQQQQQQQQQQAAAAAGGAE